VRAYRHLPFCIRCRASLGWTGEGARPHIVIAKFRSGNKRTRQCFRTRGVEPHRPQTISPEKYPWPNTTDLVTYCRGNNRLRRLSVSRRSIRGLRHPASFLFFCGRARRGQPL